MNPETLDVNYWYLLMVECALLFHPTTYAVLSCVGVYIAGYKQGWEVI